MDYPKFFAFFLIFASAALLAGCVDLSGGTATATPQAQPSPVPSAAPSLEPSPAPVSSVPSIAPEPSPVEEVSPTPSPEASPLPSPSPEASPSPSPSPTPVVSPRPAAATPTPIVNFTFYNYINDYIKGESGRSTTNLYDGGTDTSAAFSFGSGSLSALPDFSVTNGRGSSVTETQALFIGAHVRYDGGSSSSVIADKPRMSYAVSFSGALPLCWDTTNTSSSCAEIDRLETNTVIRMLGYNWLVLDYTTSGDNVSSITLGKVLSSATGMVQGDSMWIGANSKATLTEFSMAGSVRGVPRLTNFKVETPADGAMVAQLTTGDYVNVSGITMRVNRAYVDENSTVRADVTAMSNVLTLTRNLHIDSSSNLYWYADITSAVSGNSSAISRILIYSTFPNARPGDKLVTNDSMTVIPGEPAFELSYAGLAVTNETYDMLSLTIRNSSTQYSELGYWNGPFLEVVSGIPDAFRHSSDGNIVNRSMIRIPLMEMTGTTGVVVSAGTPLLQNTSGYWLSLSSIPAYTYSSSESAAITFSYGANLSRVCVADHASDGSADTRYICALLNPALGSGQFIDDSGLTSATKLAYGAADSTPAKAANFVTDRGSRIISVQPTQALIEYARAVVKARFVVKNIAQNSTSFAPANVVTRGTSPATGLVVSNPNPWWCFCKGQPWCLWCN